MTTPTQTRNDKTGTVTEGRPELTDLVLADGFDRAEVLALIAAVEAFEGSAFYRTALGEGVVDYLVTLKRAA